MNFSSLKCMSTTTYASLTRTLSSYLGDTNLINGCTGPTDPPGWVLKRKSFFCMGQSFPTDPIILVPLEKFFFTKVCKDKTKEQKIKNKT